LDRRGGLRGHGPEGRRPRGRQPAGRPSGIIGCGGKLEYLLIEDAVVGKSVAVSPAEEEFGLR
jgi:hypothetical protein